MDRYEVCLKWCSKCNLRKAQMENGKAKEILGRFWSRSRKFIKWIVLPPAIIIEVLLISVVVVSFALTGKPLLLLPITVFWSEEQTILNHIVNIISIQVGGLPLVLAESIFFGTLFVIVEYIITVIEVMEMDMMDMQIQEFEKKSPEIIELQCEVIEVQNILVNAVAFPILCIEMVAYALSLLILLSINDSSKFHFVISSVILLAPYIVLCWSNERLAGAYKNYGTFLYDFEWCNLKPKQRRTLLLIMIMADRPQLLHAGPFHLMSYEHLTEFMNRIYSYNLFLRDLVR